MLMSWANTEVAVANPQSEMNFKILIFITDLPINNLFKVVACVLALHLQPLVETEALLFSLPKGLMMCNSAGVIV